MTENDVTKGALQSAIENGDEDAALALVENDKALASSTTSAGVSWVLQAMYYRQPAIARALANTKPTLDIFESVAIADAGRVTTLLDAAASHLEEASPDGFRPLHLAAFFGHEQIVALLLSRGAEVSVAAANPMKVHPLHSAAAARAVAICRRLLEAGADANARQEAGYTALMSASMHGDQELVELLLEFRADPTLTADDGRDASAFARENQHEDLAIRLAPR